MSLDVYLTLPDGEEVYSGNITHNLTEMADAAGIYKHLWRPEELNITKASELIEPLTKGLSKLFFQPEAYMKYNPPNGWGSYEGLVKFVREYLDECKDHPDAQVSVWR